jgi:glycosyltransferase involved in cell wall biosynthesis
MPVRDLRDGVTVRRVYVDPERWWSKALATIRIVRAFAAARTCAIVHLHGFSQKSLVVVLMALAMRKKIAIKLTSLGDDDPVSMARRGWMFGWCYRRADLFFAVSPGFRDSYYAAGLPADRFRLIPNGVDIERFRPPEPGERDALRRELAMPEGAPVVLFVGFFSREKQPDALFEAWADAVSSVAPTAVLVFVGATKSRYHEVDHALVERIQTQAAARGVASRVHFVESTLQIERFHRAADIFVLPSLREGLPNALLEAMASGAACIATRLEGITDRLIDDGCSGVLVAPGDHAALAGALKRLAIDPEGRARLGSEARRTIEARYALDATARQYLEAYRHLLSDAPCAA